MKFSFLENCLMCLPVVAIIITMRVHQFAKFRELRRNALAWEADRRRYEQAEREKVYALEAGFQATNLRVKREIAQLNSGTFHRGCA